MKDQVQKKRRKLRTGFTTGTAAAAATRAALQTLLSGTAPQRVTVQLLTGDPITIPVAGCREKDSGQVACTVIKDAGDDPDITHGAEIGARVAMTRRNEGQTAVIISGGVGVGTVTKPGLEVPPGEPAINPGPKKMIEAETHAVMRAFGQGGTVYVEVFVPEGERLAEKTLNARLGIIGGLSILGTTGLVKPLSHDAYIATVESALSVAHASGLDTTVLTTGRRSERYAQALWTDLPAEAFVQIGDFFKDSLVIAAEKEFRQVILTVFFGKAVKMACGVPHTHAAKSSMALDRLATWTFDATADKRLAQQILTANTARHAFEFFKERGASAPVQRVGSEMVASAEGFAGPGLSIRGVIFDYDGNIAFDSANVVKWP